MLQWLLAIRTDPMYLTSGRSRGALLAGRGRGRGVSAAIGQRQRVERARGASDRGRRACHGGNRDAARRRAPGGGRRNRSAAGGLPAVGVTPVGVPAVGVGTGGPSVPAARLDSTQHWHFSFMRHA